MTRIVGPPKSPRRRWLLLLSLAAAVGLGLLFIPGALAVHDLQFQLDGDPFASTTTSYNGTQPNDWNSFFNGTGTGGAIAGPIAGSLATTPATGTCASVLPPLVCGFTAASAVQDFATKVNNKGVTVFDTSDSSTFTQASKDQSDVSGWTCTPASNVTNKGDIMNTYAVAYTDPTLDTTTGKHDQVLYFGLERSDNSGDANVAFWFLQGPASCDPGGGSFSGNHQDGDLLVVSAFTKGGTVPGINVYRWNGGAGGSLGTTPVASSNRACSDPLLSFGDSSCAISNTAPVLNWPWLTYNGTYGLNHSVDTGEFFEGGLNLTKSNLGGKCFNTFLTDTRSSQQLTATLYDFALGTLGECKSSVVTTPKGSDGTSAPPTSIGTAGSVNVTDSAQVTVTGVQTWSGNVKFFLCGPMQDTTSNCHTAGSGTRIQGASEPSDGIAITQGTPEPVVSAAANVTAAGRYCWRAEFTAVSPTDVPSSSDPPATGTGSDSISECFTLNPVAPTLSTTPSNSTSGTAVTCCSTPLNDTINLSGTAKEPGTTNSVVTPINPATPGVPAKGTIEIHLYGPSDTAVCTDPVTGGAAGNRVAVVTINVTGDSVDPTNLYKASTGTLVSGSLTPSGPGHYWWTASYSGDPPNTLPAPKDANNAAIYTTCGDEESFVAQIPTSLNTKQSWFPNDTAAISSTLSGDQNIAGNVDFTLYNGNCTTGTSLYTERVAISNGTSPQEASTSNYTGSTGKKPDGTTVSPVPITTGYADPANSTKPTSGTYSWKVVYTPTDTNGHIGRQSLCTEIHKYTYTNDNSGGTAP